MKVELVKNISLDNIKAEILVVGVNQSAKIASDEGIKAADKLTGGAILK